MTNHPVYDRIKLDSPFFRDHSQLFNFFLFGVFFKCVLVGQKKYHKIIFIFNKKIPENRKNKQKTNLKLTIAMVGWSNNASGKNIDIDIDDTWNNTIKLEGERKSHLKDQITTTLNKNTNLKHNSVK